MANITVLNTSSDLSSKTLISAENPYTITGLHTFDRDPSAPFAVTASSAVVTNLDADKLDGQHAPVGTIVGTSDIQTLTNKTLTSPSIGGTATGSGTLGGALAWAGTKIGLFYGGTNADLSATGGSNQVLKQSSSGAAITVGTLASTNLSDTANIPLLNLANTFSNAGGQNFTATGADQHEFKSAGQQVMRIMDSASETPYLAGYDSTGATRFGFVQFTTSATNIAQSNSGEVNFQTGGANRWGVNSAGDFTFGASKHIVDSNGTPTITAGGGAGPTISGNDYAFKVTTGSTASTTITVTFGHTFSTTPIVIWADQNNSVSLTTLSTTAVQFLYPSTSNLVIFVIVRGY